QCKRDNCNPFCLHGISPYSLQLLNLSVPLSSRNLNPPEPPSAEALTSMLLETVFTPRSWEILAENPRFIDVLMYVGSPSWNSILPSPPTLPLMLVPVIAESPAPA